MTTSLCNKKQRNIFLEALTKCILIFVIVSGINVAVYGQIPSAIVEFEGHTGILVPRMATEDIDAIADPIDGLLVYDTTLHHFFYFSAMSSTWQMISVSTDPTEAITSPQSGAGENFQVPHQPSFGATWHVEGNIGANEYSSDPPLLGTVDDFPIVFITNDLERMRIKADGDVAIVKSLEVGENLTVKQNVFLNTIGGATINNGPLTVTNQSPTLLTGTLTVDRKTQLNLGLEVYGSTTLHGLFKVDNKFSSLFTGPVTISDLTSSDSAATSTGALVVGGGVGIGQNLNVGGNLAIKGSSAFGGPVAFASPVTITADDESTNTTNGALIVYGGAGVAKRLNVGGATALGSTLGVSGNVTVNTNKFVITAASGNTAIAGTLGVIGDFGVNTNKFTVAAATGNTVVAGTLGVGGLTTLNNTSANSTTLVVTGSVAQSATSGSTAGPGNSAANFLTSPQHHVANFENTLDGNGISIKLGATTPHNQNNFITFYNSSGGTVGRIEGEDGDEDFARNREYQDGLVFAKTDIAFATLDVVIAGLEQLQAGVDFGAALGSSTACVGLGACVTAPIPSLIISGALDVILKVANIVSLGGNLATSIANLVVSENTGEALKGITFASGSEDYAEYLPKLNPEETFMPGDIVGVKNGYITKNTGTADKLMVISLNPAVLGGLPSDENVSAYEMVAFMGQVLTKIMGEVNPGDYILPGGYHNGTGIAKNPESMKPEDYRKIVGVAWEGQGKEEVGYVNTAIGLNTNDLAGLVQKQSEKIQDLEDQLVQINDNLARLIPGYAEAINAKPSDGHFHSPTQQTSSVTNDEIAVVEPTVDQIVYVSVEREHLDEAFRLAEELSIKVFGEDGMDINKHPFWNRIYTEPGFKNEVIEEILEEMKESMHMHEEINSNMTDN